MDQRHWRACTSKRRDSRVVAALVVIRTISLATLIVSIPRGEPAFFGHSAFSTSEGHYIEGSCPVRVIYARDIYRIEYVIHFNDQDVVKAFQCPHKAWFGGNGVPDSGRWSSLSHFFLLVYASLFSSKIAAVDCVIPVLTHFSIHIPVPVPVDIAATSFVLLFNPPSSLLVRVRLRGRATGGT